MSPPPGLGWAPGPSLSKRGPRLGGANSIEAVCKRVGVLPFPALMIFEARQREGYTAKGRRTFLNTDRGRAETKNTLKQKKPLSV